MDISKAIKENALDMCMTTEEAWNAATAIEDDPDLLNQGLTDAQRLHVYTVAEMTWTSQGETLLNSAVEYGTIMCVDNDIESDGYYNSEHNIIAFELDNKEYGTSRSETVFDFEEDYSYAIRTYYEEFAHAAQFNSWNSAYPSMDEDFQPADEKIWNMAIESEARTIAFTALVEHAQEGRPQFISDTINGGDMDAHMAQQTLNIYLQHGADAVEANPSLLAPVFDSFFESEELGDAYFSQAMEGYIDEITSTKRLPYQRFEQAFGTIPGMDGNMLAGHHDELTDITNLVPVDSQLGAWLQDQFSVATNSADNETSPTPVLPTPNVPPPIKSNFTQ